MGFHKVVGIDLGTTYSAVAVWDNDHDQVIVIPPKSGFNNTLPSVVGLDPEQKVIVGLQAQNNLTMDPDNTIIEVKRLMGTYERQPSGPGDPGVPKRIRFRERDYLPQEISAFILMELKHQAENYIGEPIHDAVITVPAYFQEPQKGATQDAGAMARFNVPLLLNEPTAAAVCFGADKVTDGRKHLYAVYDLGGGTFDVSIIEVEPQSVGVVGTGGNSRLGGGDFDDRIAGWVLDQIRARHGVDLSRDVSARARIKREAEQRKRDLSSATSTMIVIPYLTPQLSVNLPITRTIFEGLIDDLLQDSVNCLDNAIESAAAQHGIERDEIEQVLLVGGSTRIPKVREMLAKHMGMDIKDIRCDFNPDEVVACGAAMKARDTDAHDAFEGKVVVIDMGAAGDGNEAAAAHAPEGIILQDVTSHTLGVAVEHGRFEPIISKDSRIPASETHGGFINGGPSKEVDVLIFQGEDKIAFENTLIGKIPILLPEPRERGFYSFEVTFSLDKSGLLSISVKCLNDQQVWKAELQCNVRSSREQIESSAKKLEEEMAGGDSVPPPPPRPEVTVQAPPATVPEQFKGTARRSFKMISQMPEGEKKSCLRKAYTEFLKAVEKQSPDIESIGDALEETYIDCRK
jgi:molecular chaperone DnaK